MIKYNPARLQHLRKVHDMTQEEFSIQIGVTKRSLGNYEVGRDGCAPNALLLEKICNLFNVTPNYFFDGIEEK